MKSNKAAGLINILCDQIKSLGSAALQWLLDMFNVYMRTNSIRNIDTEEIESCRLTEALQRPNKANKLYTYLSVMPHLQTI